MGNYIDCWRLSPPLQDAPRDASTTFHFRASLRYILGVQPLGNETGIGFRVVLRRTVLVAHMCRVYQYYGTNIKGPSCRIGV
jgi:hypothetical protein